MANQPGNHLVGSIPMENAESVFRKIAGRLGSSVARISDGETGPRKDWIGWQLTLMRDTPGLDCVSVDPEPYLPPFRVRLSEGVRAEEVEFPELGYSRDAFESYEIFDRLKQEGVIPAECRFQVCLPTPLAPLSFFVAMEDRPSLEPLYEASMLNEMKTIASRIPASELAFQWDTAVEFGHLEGTWPAHFEAVEEGILERLIRLGSAVPAGIQLGYHLCYGDHGHEHFVQPKDTSRLVNIANALAAGLERPLNWIHMPVPADRTDAAYFEPLGALTLGEETEFYLGLLHESDDLNHARERAQTAAAFVSEFGVGTECGMGRTPAELLDSLIDQHSALAAELGKSS